MRARGINRSDPDMLDAGEFARSKNWIISYDEGIKLASKLKRITLISSGIEVQDMLLIDNANAIRIMLPTGSDLGMWPFVDIHTALAPNYIKYREIFYEKRFLIDKIYTAQHDNVNAARVLGLSDRLVSSYHSPVPSEYMDRATPMLFPGTAGKSKIIFVPGRKNGDPRYTHYKGVEKLPQAFLILLKNLSESQIAQIHFALTYHGNEGLSYGKKEFKAECEVVFNKYKASYSWLPNLTANQLWRLYQDSRLICLDQFGQFHGVLGGCAREALYYGVPTVTGSLGINDYLTKKLYGSPPPVLEAHEPNEIATAIYKYLIMDKKSFSGVKASCKSWASIFSKTNYDMVLQAIHEIRENKGTPKNPNGT
jgi:hypothetical protein